MSAEVSDEDEQEWSVVPSRSSKPVMRNGPSIPDSNSHVKRPQHSQKGRLAPQERGERNKTSGTVQNESTSYAVRLLRRPTTNDDTDAPHQSEDASVAVSTTVSTSKSSLQPGNRNLLDDDMRQKIGAPIIQKFSTQHKEETELYEANGGLCAEKENNLSSVRHGAEGVKTRSGEEGSKLGSSQIECGQSRDKEREPKKGGLLILPKVKFLAHVQLSLSNQDNFKAQTLKS